MKITIDAGHNYSGYDTGAVGNGLKEQNITQPIAHKLAELLRNIGIEVKETRPTLETNIGNSVSESINGRVKISNDFKSDLFISIHCNAGGGTGTETLIYSLGGQAEKLAKSVQKNIISDLCMTDRGIKVRTNLGVLKNTSCPAILIETAFIDNYNDSIKLRENQTDFANAIFKGICAYLGIAVKKDLSIAEMKSYIANKCEFSDPLGVFVLMDKHPYAEDLYKKWYKGCGGI